MIKLVVAVGNPGPKYELTRHNVGWLAFDEFFSNQSANWKSKFKGEYCDLSISGEKRYFLKPQTYMNLSGESVQPLCAFFKIKPQEVLVLHDEVDLDFGTLMFKKGGGFAGHNGLKSIAQTLGTPDYYRLRIGVGRPTRGDMSSWVLSNFSQDETISLEKLLKGTADAMSAALEKGFEKASNQYSRKSYI